jgi:hypothetical protein
MNTRLNTKQQYGRNVRNSMESLNAQSAPITRIKKMWTLDRKITHDIRTFRDTLITKPAIYIETSIRNSSI